MAKWTARTRVAGLPDDVLVLLTDPDAISRWTPVPFQVVAGEGARLTAGEQVRVQGRFGGRELEFDVDVATAGDGLLVLTATGPIRLDVEYRALPLGSGTELRASISVSGRGTLGRMLARATDALLASGALRMAVERLARELEPVSPVGEPALAI